MNKKLLALLLAAVMLFTAAGCSAGKNNTNNAAPSGNTNNVAPSGSTNNVTKHAVGTVCLIVGNELAFLGV